jgi:hypothetical protein
MDYVPSGKLQAIIEHPHEILMRLGLDQPQFIAVQRVGVFIISRVDHHQFRALRAVFQHGEDRGFQGIAAGDMRYNDGKTRHGWLSLDSLGECCLDSMQNGESSLVVSVNCGDPVQGISGVWVLEVG